MEWKQALDTRFFQQINYSASTEDGAAEILALRLQPTDKVLCVTASGARTLDLLTEPLAVVHSVDISPPQSYLLQLKMAAYQHLTYEEFRSFVGLDSSPQRHGVLKTLASALPTDARNYWEKHRSAIQRGVLYCGTWERLLKWMSCATILRRRHVRGLLEAPDVASQQAYWQQHWTGLFFKNFLRLLANRFLWVKVIREPGARLISPSFDVAGYLLKCLGLMAGHSLMRENPYANLLFYGRYTERCRLPIHLRKENYETIRGQLDRVEVHTASLLDYLNERENRFDAFSLSDFSSYAPRDHYVQVWQAVIRAARTGARYCERFFLVQHQPIADGVRRDGELEAALARLDCTCIYTFHAGTVV